MDARDLRWKSAAYWQAPLENHLTKEYGSLSPDALRKEEAKVVREFTAAFKELDGQLALVKKACTMLGATLAPAYALELTKPLWRSSPLFACEENLQSLRQELVTIAAASEAWFAQATAAAGLLVWRWPSF